MIVLVTKKYLRDLENERAGAFKEFEVVQLLKADVMREIIYINGNKNLSEDQKASLPGCLETKTFDMTNDKEVSSSSCIGVGMFRCSPSRRCQKVSGCYCRKLNIDY